MIQKALVKKHLFRFAVVLLLVALVVYLFYHVFGSSSESLMRMPVRTVTDEQTVSGDAYLFRDEALITVSSAGLIHNLVENGAKVSSGVPIAEVWDGVDPILLGQMQVSLDAINRAISILEKSLDKGLGNATPETYRGDATRAYHLICQSVRDGNWAGLSSAEEDLLIALNRYAVLSGDREELSASLDTLKHTRALLLRGNAQTVKNEGASGYFYDHSQVDGYERVFTETALSSLTADRFFTLLETPAPSLDEHVVGKIAHGYDWYLAIPMDAPTAEALTEGNRYTVRLPSSGRDRLSMTCERILTAEDGRRVVVLSSTEVAADMTYLRVQRAEIVISDCTGYYVPDSAIWERDGVLGVYIFKNSTVYFRRIDVLYRGDGYCIVAEQGDRPDDYLSPNDILITSGRNLYDGRVFQ